MDKGVWNGRRILSEQWVEASTGKRIDNGQDPEDDWNQGYGYQFWLCRHGAYRAGGAFGQFIIVLPQQDAILALTSSVNDMPSVMNAVWDGLLPALDKDGEALESSLSSTMAFADKLASLRVSPPAGIASKPGFRTGTRYRLEANPLGMAYVELHDNEEGGRIVWSQDGQERALKYGESDWAYNESTEAGPVLRAAASGCWIDEYTFILTVRPIETAFVQTFECRLQGDGISIAYACEYSLCGPKELVIEGKAC